MPVNMSALGKGLLAAVFLLYGFALCFGLAALKLETETAKKVLLWARRAILVAAGLAVGTLFLFAVAFLTDDFSIAAVAQMSCAELPFYYKIGAVWANSAGSLVLWSVGVFVLFALWLARSKTGEMDFDAAALSIGSGVCLGFSAILVFIAKPFASSPVTVDDGAGLNPALQNFWMISHPPLLFVGYSAFVIAFVVALASVFVGRVKDSYVYRQLRHWLLFGICFLGLGIATGARWSYAELGWGGYWAWDPVENASLLPWLVAVAALHGLIGMRLADKFKLWTIILAPLPFILCLLGTFITRSGILQSIHSFGQDIMFSALLAFIGCSFLLWMACIIRAVKKISISPSRPGAYGLDKSEILFWANLIFIFTAVVIGTATFWPVIGQVITGSNSGFTLTRVFYDRVISAVGILLAFLVGLVALADLRRRPGFMLKLSGCCAAGLICLGLVFDLSDVTLLLNLACGICAFSFIAVLMKLWFSLKAGGKIAAQIAHLGLLLLVVTAGFSSNEQSIQALLTKGGKVTLGQYSIVYDSFEHKFFGGATKVGPEIVVRKKGLQKTLWPHNNLYPDGQSTSEVAVHTGLLEDIYISFDGVARDGMVRIAVKTKPLMLWLWFAVLLIVAGLALAMLEGRRARK